MISSTPVESMIPWSSSEASVGQSGRISDK